MLRWGGDGEGQKIGGECPSCTNQSFRDMERAGSRRAKVLFAMVVVGADCRSREANSVRIFSPPSLKELSPPFPHVAAVSARAFSRARGLGNLVAMDSWVPGNAKHTADRF